jgi:drug/metabolite transporter (DMT)-like permease
MSAVIAVGRPAIEYRRGALLVTGATIVWSSAGLLARMVPVDPATTLFWRSVFAGAFLLLYLAWRDGAGMAARFRRLGAAGIAMGLCFGISMICFITALSMTTVAAVLVFQAAAPLFAAVMARAFLNERVGRAKLLAILVSFAGVLLIVSGADSIGTLWGNLVSAVMGITYAATIVLARARPDVPTTEATVLGIALVGLVTAPFATFVVGGHDLALFGVFGIFQMGLALIMFTAGIRLIPAADAGLISVLESVLAPVLVWIAFAETPGTPTLVGGAVVIAAVLWAAMAERGTAA